MKVWQFVDWSIHLSIPNCKLYDFTTSSLLFFLCSQQTRITIITLTVANGFCHHKKQLETVPRSPLKYPMTSHLQMLKCSQPVAFSFSHPSIPSTTWKCGHKHVIWKLYYTYWKKMYQCKNVSVVCRHLFLLAGLTECSRPCPFRQMFVLRG